MAEGEEQRIAEYRDRIAKARESGSEISEDQERIALVMATILTDPLVKANLARMQAKLRAAAEQVAHHVVPVVNAVRKVVEQTAPVFAFLAEALPSLLAKVYLPNWVGVHLPDDTELIERVLLDEGIPLAWVPQSSVLQTLLDAESPRDRRQILQNRWRSILTHCESELSRVSTPHLEESRDFALRAVAALRRGHPAASQALSANLLDTVLRAHYGRQARAPITGFRRRRLDIDDYAFREAIVLGGIFGAHESFDGDSGERPPRNFSRHASAHAVSRLQYTRVNALLALMHVTALLQLISAGSGAVESAGQRIG